MWGCADGAYCSNVTFAQDQTGMSAHDPRRVAMRTLERMVRSLGNYKVR